MSAERLAGTAQPIRVGFLYANDPDPLLLERMAALEATGRYEPHVLYWHRTGSPLSIPFISTLPAACFNRVDLPDPRGGLVRRALLSARFAWAAVRWLRRLRPDAVHAVYPDMLAVARIALAASPRVPLVYDLWDVIGPQRPPAPMRWLYRLLLRRVGLVCISSAAYEGGYLVHNALLRPSTPVLDASNCPPCTGRPTPAPLPDGPLTIGYIGNVRVREQVNALVAAAETVRAEGRAVRILIAGAGQDSALAQRLAEEHSFVEYLGPYDHATDAPGLYARVHAVFAVYPQRSLNYRLHLARRLHDSIISGRPVIVARGSHMASVVESEGTGWSVGDDDTEGMAALLRRLCDEPAMLQAGAECALTVRKEHCFERYSPGFIAAYDRLTCS
jgi:glycosyltransferase involved in cell wall biosynthesis